VTAVSIIIAHIDQFDNSAMTYFFFNITPILLFLKQRVLKIRYLLLLIDLIRANYIA